MKRVLTALLLSCVLFSSANLRAAEINYSGAYGGSMASSMMTAMWDFMEWFLGQRNNSWRNPGMGNGWSNPYRYRDYWDDPSNPWVGMQPMDGTWMAQSGEYWYVRGNRFVLVSGGEKKAVGEFLIEGNFILTRLPWGEVEFEYRQMDDLLILRDVAGRVMLLRRVEGASWNW